MPTKKNIKLVIDGMTGVGKSSLVEIVAGELDLVPYAEIFEDKHRLLYKFFEDRTRWAFPMQVNFLHNRFQQFKEAFTLDKVDMDRSIFSTIFLHACIGTWVIFVLKSMIFTWDCCKT